jgi:putative ABC transport system permease protein
MSYPKLIWRNVARNKRRLILTVLSIALALFALATLLTFVSETDRRLKDTSPLRLVTRHSISLANFLPERYRAQIEKVPGVVAVTQMSWYGGVYIDEAHTDFTQFSCDPKTFFDVYPEFQISPDEKQAFMREKNAVIVGRRKAEKYGWKPGDRIYLKGEFYPVDLDLIVRGVFAATPIDESVIYFHDSYLKEALGQPGVDGIYRIRADSLQSVPRILQMVDGQFQNTDAPTKTETERAFRMGFISMLGNLNGLVAIVSSVIVFTILLVTANSMAMSVRERVREIAILKSLGFTRPKLFGVLITEGLAIGLAGGLVGLGVARFLFEFVDIAALTKGTFQSFQVTSWVAALGLAISALVGVGSFIVPVYRATGVTVSDGLRHMG